ncbi:MAG: thiosulfate sulfurtransferase [Parasphingorhabdus sp.]|jgi:thiosulfate sulfurtransferase
MPYKCISIDEAVELIDVGEYALLDIRDAASYSAGNVDSSINVTNNNVEQVLADADKQKPLIVYCYHGNSSQGAADYFARAGFEFCYSVDGGYEQWKHRL